VTRVSAAAPLGLLCVVWLLLPHPRRAVLPRSAPHGELLTLTQPRQITAIHLDELSGLVQSPRHEGVFWAHNDSLDEPRLFAITEEGGLLSEHPVLGATNIDWEDLTFADGELDGLLFIGDTGNNFHWRGDLSVYVLREPSPGANQAVRPLGRYRYRFPDQGLRPPLTLDARCRDAEALFWAEGALYLISKCFWGGRAPLYRLPIPSEELDRLATLSTQINAPPNQADLELSSARQLRTIELTLEWVGDLEQGQRVPPFGWRVTAADYLPEQQRLAVLSYFGVGLYPWPLLFSEGTATPERVVRFPRKVAKQVEALTWLRATRGEALIGNEQRELWRVNLR